MEISASMWPYEIFAPLVQRFGRSPIPPAIPWPDFSVWFRVLTTPTKLEPGLLSLLWLSASPVSNFLHWISGFITNGRGSLTHNLIFPQLDYSALLEPIRWPSGLWESIGTTRRSSPTIQGGRLLFHSSFRFWQSWARWQETTKSTNGKENIQIAIYSRNNYSIRSQSLGSPFANPFNEKEHRLMVYFPVRWSWAKQALLSCG